ncbi:MAG: DMT family transporter [Gemmatimonadetes bacterium]|nr:DMT family transporter [Gemmatimonadota bacterium]
MSADVGITVDGEVRGASRIPELTLMLVTLVWGSTFIVTQVALRETGPFSLLAARFVVGAVTLLAIFAGRMRGLRVMEVRVGIMIGLVTFASYSLQTIGLQHIASSKSAFITALYVPLVPLLQLLLLRQAPRLAAWIGIALAFAGLLLMSVGKGMDLAIGVGEWLTLGSAVGAALQIILLSRWVRQSDPMRLAFVQLSTVSILSLAGAGVAGERMPALSPTLVSAALGLGLLGTAFALGAMSWAQRTVSATRATVIYSMEPVWGGLIGAWAGELMTPAVVGGSTLVLLGVLTSELRWPRGAAREGSGADPDPAGGVTKARRRRRARQSR